MQWRQFIKGIGAALPGFGGRLPYPSMNPRVDLSNPIAYGLTGAYLPGRASTTR